ncbi:MAG: STAS domain-containing protein [Nocardioides sp.]
MAGTIPRPPPDNLLRIEVHPSDDVIHVRLIGEMDLSTRGQLMAALETTPLNGAPFVNFDMTQLDFCDASGISDLLHTRDAMARQQRTCSASAPRPHLRKLFTLAGLTELLAPELSRAETA